MADIKWIKLATNMHEDEKMKLIDAMPLRDTIHYVWIRILLLGGKLNANGEIFLSEGKPLTAKMLAILFSRPLEDIKIALKVLSQFGMIEIAPDKVIRIVNWDKHQNIEGMERVREQNRKRAENHREKKKLDKKTAESNKGIDENIALDEMEELEPIEGTLEDYDTLNKNEVIENLEKGEEVSTNSIYNDKTNNDTNETPSNSIVETVDNNCSVTKNTSNVTQNKSNVTVTEQNKKEIENKKKNKKEKREIEKDKNIESKKNNGCSVNNKSLTCEVNNKNSTCDEELSQSSIFEDNNTKSECAAEEDINLKALDLMHYHEKITGKVGGCDYVALRSAIDIHGEKMVKMAMDVGFERNCPDIKYAIGVLKNWRRDGYPEDDMEVKKNGFRSTGKSKTADKNEFAGFRPKEPRKLTEAERKRIEANLI